MHAHIHKSCAALICALVWPLNIEAQTKPNLTGSWKVNTAKSHTGGDIPPDWTVRIRHQEPELILTQIIGGASEDFRLTTDGKESTNTVRQGQLKSTARWEKDALLVESAIETGQGKVVLKDKLELSADAKTMHIARRISAPSGESNWTLVFEKEAAAALPDFTGTWKLNVSRSNFGPLPAPESSLSKVDHKDPELKVSTTTVSARGERKMDFAFRAGGETSNQIGSFTLKSAARWEGSVLLIDSKGSFDAGEITIKDKWSLSENGKTLTIVRTMAGPQGEAEQTLIHEK